MKKHSLFMLAALILAIPAVGNAEIGVNGSANASADIRVNAPAGFRVNANGSTTVRDQIRIDNQTRLDNIKANENRRNEMMRERVGIATSTRGDIRDMRQDGREGMWNASSTGERREIRADMRLNIFTARKNALVSQLNLSIQNLRQIEARINARIAKDESAGKDMTAAKAAISLADAKFALAEQAIVGISAYVPPVSADASATTSASIDLGRPRQIGQDAIRAVEAVREALRNAVRTIMNAEGAGAEATSTTSVTTP